MKNTSNTIVSAIALLASACSAFAQCAPVLETPWSVPMAPSPYALTIADFNGDGLKDIAVSSFTTSSAAVRLALSSTPRDFGAPFSIALGVNPRGVASGDFNRDGRAELAVVHAGGPTVSRLAIISFSALGTPAAPTLYPISTAPFDLRATDVNADGNTDLISLCGCGSIDIFTGNANGTFNPLVQRLSGLNSILMATPDLNDDGLPDLIFPNIGQSQFAASINTNPATLGYGTSTNFSTPGLFGNYAAEAGDFNNDGRDDFVIGSSFSNKLQVFLTEPNGNPIAQPEAFTCTTVSAVAVGDLNGDGNLDVVSSCSGSSSVSVHLGNGTGALGAPTSFTLPAGTSDVAIADMDNNGKLDIIACSQTAGTISILYNITPQISFSQAPNPQRVCPQGSASFFAAAQGPVGATFSYRWQYRLPGGNWTDLTNAPIPNIGTAQNVTTQTLSLSDIQGAPGSVPFEVRARATTAACANLVSQPASITIIRQCSLADLGAQGGLVSSCGDGFLDNNDFVAFISLFFAGSPAADLGSQGGILGTDGSLDNNDFVAFVNIFFQGCQS